MVAPAEVTFAPLLLGGVGIMLLLAGGFVWFVVTFQQRKRGALLWDVFQREVLPAVPAARLWMVCSDAPPAPGVEVLGHLSDADLRDRYWRASVFCLPSSYEGFGIPYVEAMASGVPVVSTDVGGVTFLVQHEQTALLVPPGDAQAMAGQVLRLLQEPGLATRLVANGLREVQRYTWSAVAPGLREVYMAALDSKRV